MTAASSHVLGGQFRERPDGPSRRIVEARCAWRPCSVKNDSTTQTRNASTGLWEPDLAKVLAAQGWVVQNDEDRDPTTKLPNGKHTKRLFCSKRCAHLHAYHGKQNLTVEPVQRIDDAQYAKTIAKSPEAVRKTVAPQPAPKPLKPAKPPRPRTVPEPQE